MTLPLLCLRPLVDENARWYALRLEAANPLSTELLTTLFERHALAESGLRCIVDLADPDSELLDALSAEHLELRLKGDCPTSRLAQLASAGFHLCSLDGHPDLPSCPTLNFAVPLDDPPRGSSAHRASLLRLLALVTADADTHEIEQAIKRDPELSFKLLKLVNSVALGGGKISTFTQAIALLGRRQLQRWLQLLLYARSDGGSALSPLLPLAARRATWMEQLALKRGGNHESADHHYMIGMFSLLDKLLGLPLAELLSPLNLTDDINAALLSGEGSAGQVLTAVAAGEQGCAGLAEMLTALAISPENWIDAQIEACRWAMTVVREL